MKKPALLLVLFLALLGGYFVASPYLALRGLGQALDSGDQTALEAHVDFPGLRQNLKDQLSAAFAQQTRADDSDNPLAAFAATLAGAFMNPVIDAFVTPAGLSQLLKGKAEDADAQPDPFAQADTAFESLSVFRVTLHQADGDRLDLFLRREGLSWKLYRIDLPLDALAKPAA
ncbi:MAG: DUF2939 domain-containing protein [Pseudomonadota bacterium]